MRYTVVSGFIIIVLILIAGCSSPQNTANAAKSLNPDQSTSMDTTPVLSEYLPTGCETPTPDPIRFQKFLPDVSGWKRDYGQTVVNFANYMNRPDPGSINSISEGYQSDPKSITVSIQDQGPCVNQTTGVFAYLNPCILSPGGPVLNDVSCTKIDNFHGYMAYKSYNINARNMEDYRIGINNRVMVIISASSNSEYLLPDIDADVEKIANAIDFSGIASST